MPFTPSHAVVALPFIRTPLIPAAIAVGAMTPDLPLFVRGTPLTYGITHDPLWIPVTTLVAFALLVIWRCALRPAARELSPRWFAARMPEAWDEGAARALRETVTGHPGRASSAHVARYIALLLLSLAAGVASHIAWDSFTHEGRTGVALFPSLDAMWGPMAGIKWLQHGSSLLGLVILGVWGWRWLRRRAPAAVSRVFPDVVRWAWWLSLPLVLAIAAIVGYVAFGPFTPRFTPQHLAYRVLPPACAAWAVATLVLAFAVAVRRRRPA